MTGGDRSGTDRPIRVRSGPAALIGANACIAFTVTLLVVLESRPGRPGPISVYVSDLGQTAAPAAASVTAAWAATSTGGRLRRSWLAVSLACAAWGTGQAWWAWEELVQHVEAPFPSLSDVGYTLFPVGMVVALALFPTGRRPGGSGHLRQVLDGGIVAASLGLVGIATQMIGHDVSVSGLALLLSVFYPLADVVVLTAVVLAIGRPGPQRPTLLLLAAGLVAMSVSDGAFFYLIGAQDYATGALFDLGWIYAFALIGLAAVASVQQDARAAGTDTRRSWTGADIPGSPPRPGPARLRLGHDLATALPYLPLLLACGVATGAAARGHLPSATMMGMGTGALGLVLVRQYLTLVDNRRLVETLAVREAELQRLAFHDSLTGLANRELFTARVREALEGRGRHGDSISVLACDLDDFKAVNDGLGHAAGDRLLALVAHRLLAALPPRDVLARLGGDEFAVLLTPGSRPQAVGQRIAAALGQPFRLAETTVILRASVGSATLGRQDQVGGVDDLLARADVAMYAAKRAGKGRFAAYLPGMTLPETRDLRLRGPLARALSAMEVHAHLQPIVSLSDGSVIGYEALARWQLDGVDVPPAEFVPVAARSGLMPRLTDLMLDAACREVARWAHGPDLALSFGTGRRPYVAVNVAPSELVDVRLPDRVRAALEAHDVPPQHLAIEITEDALLTDPATARSVCAALTALGVRLSLDDFGTGYSSLAHLAALPLHTLKIDQGFVAEVDRDSGAERMARALVGLAEDLGLELVAEGVERLSQAQVLRRMGCTHAQGYAFGAPSPADVAPAPRSATLPLATPAIGVPLVELDALLPGAGGR